MVAVGDRQDDRLSGASQSGSSPREVLDQDPDEALIGAHQRAMDHHRLMFGIVGPAVGETEALGHVVVELAGAELPGAPQRVGHVQVDLRAIEGAVAGVQLVLEPRTRARSISAASLCPITRPIRSMRRVASRARGGRRGRSPVGLERREIVGDLVLDLLLGAVDVGVILGEGAHPKQTMQRRRSARAGAEARLPQPQGQVAVGVALQP